MKHHLFAAFGFCVLLLGCAADPRDTADPRDSVSTTEQDIGGGGPPGCESKAFCYCKCRVDHPCFLDQNQCGPLGSCLTSCDHQYPQSCPDSGPQFPRTLRECL